MGATITILALAFEPFFQQIVSFPARDINVDVSTVAVSRTYRPDDDVGVRFRITLDSDIRGPKSMMLAVEESTLRNATTRPAPSVCPTGRCNWTSYDSLGVCHRCVDLSNLPRYICENGSSLPGRRWENICGYRLNNTFITGKYGYKFKYSLGTSAFLVGEQDASDARIPDQFWNSTVFMNVPSPILDFYIAYTPGGLDAVRQNVTPILQECLFHWCIKTYEASYGEGRLYEKLVSTYAGLPNVKEPEVPEALRRFLFADGRMQSPAFNMTSKDIVYNIPENVTKQLGYAVFSTLPSRITYGEADNDGQFPGKWNFPQVAPYKTDSILGDIAEAMTNNMRASKTGTEQISGNAWTTENFVEIRWVWISLPGVVLLSTLAFVGITAFRSHKNQFPVWKSSALVTLLHGLTEEARERFDPKASPSEVEAISQKMRVRLSTHQDGNIRLGVA